MSIHFVLKLFCIKNISALNPDLFLMSVFSSFIKSFFFFSVFFFPQYVFSLYLCLMLYYTILLHSGRVRTRRQSSGSAVGANSTVTDSRGRSRAKVVSQSQRTCPHSVYSHLTHFKLFPQLESLFYNPPCQMWPSSFSEKHTLTVWCCFP